MLLLPAPPSLSMMLTITQWYAISLAALGLTLVVFRTSHLLSTLYRRCRFLFLFLAYTLLVHPKYCSNVTLLQGLIFSLYLGGNGVCMLLDAQNSIAVIGYRCAILSVVNMIPLFLAGRSSRLISYLGIPLHVHHLLHHWVGRVSLFQAFLHVLFAFVSHTDKNLLTTSGTTAATTLGCMLAFSLFPIRKHFFEIFFKVHQVFAVLSLAALLWHVIAAGPPSISKLLFPLLSLTLWVLDLVSFLYNLRIRSRSVEITRFDRINVVGQYASRELDVLQIDINLNSPCSITPGQFVYLRIRDFYISDKIQTHPFMISWWESEEVRNGLTDDKSNTMCKAEKLTILIRPANGLTRRLSSKDVVDAVSFDGPLGQSLRLEKYENVSLVAKGIGLAGVLSYAKHIIDMKSHPIHKRRVITRKLDLYWELEDNSQENWGGPFLRKLQILNNDISSSLLQVWCYFPTRKTSTPLVNLDDVMNDFQYFYPDSESYMEINKAIRSVAATSAGRSIVVACGVSPFSSHVRNATLKTMWSLGSTIEFVEAEYRPRISSVIETEEPRRFRPMKISGPISSLKTKERGERMIRGVTFV